MSVNNSYFPATYQWSQLPPGHLYLKKGQPLRALNQSLSSLQLHKTQSSSEHTPTFRVAIIPSHALP